MGKNSVYMKTAEGKRVGIQRKLRKLSPPVLPPPSSLSNLLKTQQGQLTSLITTATGLPLPRIERDGEPDGGEWLRGVGAGSGVSMGGSAAEGRNKSAE